MKIKKAILVFGLAAAIAACGDDDPASGDNDAELNANAATSNDDSNHETSNDDESNEETSNDDSNHESSNDEPNGEDGYDGPTYHDDIAPMMQVHCTACHVPDEMAPFALQTYEEVKATSSASHVTMVEGTMPPWPPNKDCAEIKDHRGISTEEVELFEAWIDAGHPEGEPNDEPMEGPPSTDVEAEADRVLDWGFDYKPTPPDDDSIDDYRCFVVDPDIDEEKFVNLIHTRPDNAEVVHHMIAYTAPGSAADDIAALKAEDDRPGYECFGGPRTSDSMWLSAWAPGEVPTPFMDGYGIRLKEDDHIIIQMHYNTVNDPEGTDRTEVDLYFVDEEEYPEPTELAMIPLPDHSLHLEAGDPEASTTWQAPTLPIPITVHGIFPHMHMLGTKFNITVDPGEEDEMCLIDIPNWDFDWQGFYMYEEPMVIPSYAEVEMYCEYDNSADNQAPGRTPQDVYWGDGTYDEMCLGVIVAELPPGAAELL